MWVKFVFITKSRDHCSQPSCGEGDNNSVYNNKKLFARRYNMRSKWNDMNGKSFKEESYCNDYFIHLLFLFMNFLFIQIVKRL